MDVGYMARSDSHLLMKFHSGMNIIILTMCRWLCYYIKMKVSRVQVCEVLWVRLKYTQNKVPCQCQVPEKFMVYLNIYSHLLLWSFGMQGWNWSLRPLLPLTFKSSIVCVFKNKCRVCQGETLHYFKSGCCQAPSCCATENNCQKMKWPRVNFYFKNCNIVFTAPLPPIGPPKCCCFNLNKMSMFTHFDRTLTVLQHLLYTFNMFLNV